MHPAHICVCTNQVEVAECWCSVFMQRWTSPHSALTIMCAFVSDRVERSTVAHVEEETAAGAVNASQRRELG